MMPSFKNKKMNKFNLQEDEKSRILSMHKSLIREQDSSTTSTPTTDVPKSIADQLEVFVTNGCVKNGKVVPMTSTNPQKKYAIKQESTITPGKFRYFFIDNTIGMLDETGKFKTLPNKWSCNTGVVKNIASIKTEAGWKNKKELEDSGQTIENIENPLMYNKKDFNGQTLYQAVTTAGIFGGLTEPQRSKIQDYKDMGYKLIGELTPKELSFFKPVVVSPKSAGLFSTDLIMYADPSQITQGVKSGEDGKVKTNITTTIQSAVESRIPKDPKDCKDTIVTYYYAYTKKRPLSQDEFDALKEKTMACKSEYYGDWPITIIGTKGKTIDKYLDIMSGGIGGPSRKGADAKWRLN